jgi:hypothetical protein
MDDHHNTVALLVSQLSQYLDHVFSISLVQVAGRFIGQDYPGTARQATLDGHLLLPHRNGLWKKIDFRFKMEWGAKKREELKIHCRLIDWYNCYTI